MESLADVLTQPGAVLLDTARLDAENQRSLLFVEPRRVLRANTPEDVLSLLEAMEAAAEAGFHLTGYLSYEAGYAFQELASPPAARGPLAWFGVYEAPQDIDPAAVDRFFAANGEQCRAEQAGLALDQASYTERIRAIRQYIREGDVYQINFTDRMQFEFEGDPLAFYGTLRQRQRVPYGAFLNTGARHILSLSPELFFRREGEHIVTRPMKGTIRRGRTNVEDEALRARLAADAKNQAENLMIVDLLRNDLSVCCRPGSVQVPALFETTCFESVTQMTSTVEGYLREGVDYATLFQALFPCGSVTGAPKRRAMRRIRELEADPRGIYCGAIGHIAPDEQACFNVAIRTVVLEDGNGIMGTGSGIVWDSDPEAEYEESRLKAHFLTEKGSSEDFRLIETMRWEDGAIRHRSLHLNRLRDSAHYFGFACDIACVRRRLAAETESLPAGRRHKVRLTLGRHGDLEVTTAPLAASWEEPLRLTFADAPVDSENVFLYHKTTRRDMYEKPYRRAQEDGFDEVLFVNERGEITEGSRTNVFIRDGDRWRTPPVANGLLGGTERRHLLQTLPHAEEDVLRPADLREAEEVYVCNALRGLCRAELKPGALSYC